MNALLELQAFALYENLGCELCFAIYAGASTLFINRLNHAVNKAFDRFERRQATLFNYYLNKN